MLETVGIAPDDDLPEPEVVEKKLDRLLRERNTMGPVNLRAEEEAHDIEEQIAIFDMTMLSFLKLFKILLSFWKGIDSLS